MVNVLHLGLSYACNMRCKHCFVRKKKDLLTEEDYCKIIDAMIDNGMFVMYYTFGEPLLSNLFDKVSKYACQKKIIQVLMTNGALLTPEKISILKGNNISKVCVSIDHIMPEKHDKNRGYEGAYNKAIAALKLLVENNFNTQMSVTINDNNVFFLDRIYDLAKELKVNAISFLRERKDGTIAQIENEDKYLEFFEKVVTNENKVNVLFHDHRLLSPLRALKENGKINDLTYEKYYEMNLCHSGCTISVEPNGDLKRCNLNSRVYGNVLNKPIDLILREDMNINECFDNCAAVS